MSGMNLVQMKAGGDIDGIIAALDQLPHYRVKNQGTESVVNVSASYGRMNRASLFRTDEPDIVGGPDSPEVVRGGMFAAQRMAYQSLSKFAVYVGGMGSGKTEVGCRKSLALALTNNGVPHLCVAPTLPQSDLYHSARIREILEERGISYRWNGSARRLSFNYGRNKALLYFISGGDPQKIIGFNPGSIWMDEPFVQPQKTFQQLVRRLRAPNAVVRQLLLTGTPENLGWGRQLCDGSMQGGNGQAINPFVVVAPTIANRALARDYIRDVIASCSVQEFRAYVLGEFVNLTEGVIYHGFDTERNLVNWGDVNDGGEIDVGLDFNVNPMCAVIGWFRRNHLHFFREIRLEGSNTHEMAQEIRRMFPDRKINVFPDPSGRARKTSSPIGVTDLTILESYGFNVIHSGQLSRRDTWNAANVAMNPVGRGPMVTFNPDGCRQLILDLQELSYSQLTRQKLENRDHGPDAMKYCIYQRFPISAKMGNRHAY